jgi:peptidoglycan/LPS O-acetylase OafA/YrhL
MSDPTPERAKISSLEGLRGVMAWWVVLGHVSLALDLHLPLIDDNVLAVDVFILLSGFVIFLLIDRKRETFWPYVTRRAFRIFPLYLVVLAISALLLNVQLAAWREIPFATNVNAGRAQLAAVAMQHWPAHLAVHIPLLQGLIPTSLIEGGPWTIVGQAWSVSLEWQFYLLAPIFFWALGTSSASRLRLLAALLLMAALAFMGTSFTPAFLGAKIWHFGLGMTSYLLIAKPDRRRESAALAAVFCVLIVAGGGAKQLVPILIWAIVLGSAVSPVHSRGHLIAATLSRPAFLRLGEMSYSVYLVHMIPVVIGVWALNQWHVGTLAYRVILLAFVTAATLLIARLTFRHIERPGIDAGAHLTKSAVVAQTS